MDVRKLRIINYPAAVLRQKAEPIKTIDSTVEAVAHRMIELMGQAQGVGLAGPQVGLSWRIFVANATGQPDDNLIFINPALSAPSMHTAVHNEGCLSLPYITADITRPVGITIEATALNGERFTLTSEQLPARIWQHEFDHLNGVLIIDRMTPMDRMANASALRDLEKAVE